MSDFQYKSFCWSIGTTSFRTIEFNRKIERQLALLNEFWAIPKYADKPWSKNKSIQTEYYRFLQQKGFLDGNAPRPEKDAREKTSGLVSIDLIDSERRLTAVGQDLLSISEVGDFKSDNPLQISKDSFIYLKQLLKTHIDVDGEIVRPYAVFAYEYGSL